MGKRQRSHTSEDADGPCKGKRLSAEHGRSAAVVTSPLLTVSESSQSDNEVDIVWGHSPPPLNWNLRTTPGPKTRRKSDYTNKDIADMIECIHSRNSSQQSPTISTPPLLGLWMQGRQDVEMTPVGARGQRLSRKVPSRKPSTEAWASLAKDLHMLAEASKDFPLSQQPAAPQPTVPPEGDSEDVSASPTYENLHTNGAPECQNVSLVTPERFPSNQNDGASEDSPTAELWGDDSWFETDSIVRIATQVEEQEASKKLEGAHIDTHSTVRGNGIPQTMEFSGKKSDTNKHKNAFKCFIPANKNTNVSLASHSDHQFTSPPNCRRLSRNKMFQKPPECNLKKENSTKGRASFHFSSSKGSVGFKKEGLPQFSKQCTPLEEANSLKLDNKGGDTKVKAASVVTTGRSQIVKDAKNDTSGINKHTENVNQSLVANTKTANVSSAGIGNSNKTFDPVEEVLDDCNESMDLFEASLVDEEVERKVKGQEKCRSKEGHLNFQNARKGAIPLNKTNKLDSDLSSDLSFIDEELLAAVELEEMHWEEISSQHGNEDVKTSKTSCTDKELGNRDSFAVPHPVRNAGSSATVSALNQAVIPALGKKKLQSSQFSFKSSQKNSQKGVKQVVDEQTFAKNANISLSTQQQMKSPVSAIVDHNNRMKHISGKHEKCVNQFSAATTEKKGGNQFERIKPLQFSSSQSVQFQQKKSAAKVENNLTIQNVKLVPTTSNSQVSIQSSNFSPFKAPVSSQFVKSTTSGSLKDRVVRTDSLPLSEKDIVSATPMEKQTVQPAKSSKDPISLAKKDSCTTTGTSHPVGSSVGKKVPETISSNNGSNTVQPSRGSRDTFQLGENLSERKKYGQTLSTHLPQFQSGSKDRKSEKTSNSSMSHSKISLKDENKSDTSSISRNPGVKTSSQFQTKPSYTNNLSVNQVTSNSDLNSSAFSHVSSQFSSSSQVKCNDTCSEVTPSPVFTTNTVRPPVTGNDGAVPQLPKTGTSWSVLNRHSTDNSKSLQRKAKDKETFSVGTLNAKSLHRNQFSQFSKAKKEHSALDNLLERETLLTAEDHFKEGSVCTFQGIKERLEMVQDNHTTLSDASHSSNLGQKTSSQFVKAGHVHPQSSPLANKSKPVLTTVTNVYANDGKQPVVTGCAKQFSKVSRTSSAHNGELVSFQNERIECAETRKDCDLKLSQKTGVIVNPSTTVKTSQGNSKESILKPQNQLQKPRTNIVTITPSHDKRPCSQEQIEQKRREALARKKRRENLIGNHSMNLRERTIIKK